MLLNRTKIVDKTPTITAGAYSAADVIGGLQTLDVANAGGGGILRNIIIADDDNEKAEITFYFFSAAPTTIADNAAFAPVIADLKNFVGKVVVAATDYTTVNLNAYGLKSAIDMHFVIPTGNLYVYAVVTATPTYAAATDLTFRYVFSLDAAA